LEQKSAQKCLNNGDAHLQTTLNLIVDPRKLRWTVDRKIWVRKSKYMVTGDPLFTGGEGVTWPTFDILGHPSISH